MALHFNRHIMRSLEIAQQWITPNQSKNPSSSHEFLPFTVRAIVQRSDGWKWGSLWNYCRVINAIFSLMSPHPPLPELSIRCEFFISYYTRLPLIHIYTPVSSVLCASYRESIIPGRVKSCVTCMTNLELANKDQHHRENHASFLSKFVVNIGRGLQS